MGLDFYVIAVKESEIHEMGSARDVVNSWSYEEFTGRELAYGRKSWELVHELHCDTHTTCMSRLTKKNWINLQEKLAPIGPSLPRIAQAYRVEGCQYDSPQDRHYRDTYVRWYDESFPDEGPTLGYEFSIGYMSVFWESADKVLETIEDPDWQVWMLASY